MCGIAGRFASNCVTPEDVGRVQRMIATMRHRGPDGDGAFQNGHVALAVCRLSIVDVEGGGQPLTNETGSVVLVANGEIYNAPELRAGLRDRGHRLATGSDCECIVHLYEEFGAQCVEHLRGMFAFALWDQERRLALLARDRLGEKPLYISDDGNGLYFASELRPMVVAGVVAPALNLESVAEYFHFGYVPEPQSILRGVRKLPAGAMLLWDAASHSAEQRTYWRLEDSPPVTEEPAKAIRQCLDEIGRLTVRADVPIGVSLSSGVDSSAVAALAAANSVTPVHAFTVGYEGDPRMDERAGARRLAERLGLVMHEVQLTAEDAAQRYVGVVARCDDPIADGAAVAYDAIARAARDSGVPVLLAGHGGDELFLRYAWCRQAVHATELRHRANAGGVTRLLDYWHPTRPPVSYVGGLAWLQDGAGLRTAWRCWQSDRVRAGTETVCYEFTEPFRTITRHWRLLFGRALAGVDIGAAADRLHREMPCGLPADLAVMKCATEGYLRENGIAQGDRLSMANSVELRLPLVDFRLVETVAGLRVASKLPTAGDAWFREAVAELLPREVLSRRKRGFCTPWRQWRREIFSRFGKQLSDGVLESEGVLVAGAGRRLASGFALCGVPIPGAVESLALETWLRGIRSDAGPRVVDDGASSVTGTKGQG